MPKNSEQDGRDYLGAEAVVFLEKGVVIGEEGVVGGFEAIEVVFQLLSLPPGATVLEPNSHLPRLQAELPS